MSAEPTSYEVTLVLPEGERTIQVGADEHIWDAALKAGIKLPALCHQGRCLTCAGRLVDGGEVDQSDSISYFPRIDKRALCCCAPASRVPRCGFSPTNRTKCGSIAGSMVCPRRTRSGEYGKRALGS